MSNYGDLYEKPPINLVDGVVGENTILDFGYQIESSFEQVGDIFGNLYGLGYNTLGRSLYFNSVAAAIGDLSKVALEEPFGLQFEEYTETFSTSGNKDYVLDLIPDAGTIGQTVIDAPDYTWTYRTSLDDLSADGDFTITGRVLTFYKAPASGFSIIYNGTYPDITGSTTGFTPNVYPSPKLIQEGHISRPTLSILPSGKYKVVIEPYTFNSDLKQFGAPLELNFGPLIQPYVDSSATTDLPAELASVWVLNDEGYFSKLDVRSINLVNSVEFQFESDESLDPQTDTVVIALSNVTIADTIKDIYTLLREHTHDKTSASTPISHDRLINLIPISDNAEIVYGGSNIPNNDHPQYFHREGYRASDPGTYDNAILGDLLIGSIDSSSLYNNVDADSNRLTFGSISQGISLSYRHLDQDLLMYSPENGLSIETSVGPGKESFALRLNRHQFFNYQDTEDHLTIASTSGTTRFGVTDDDDDLGSIQALNGTFVGRVIFPDLAGLTIGNIDIYSDSSQGYEIIAESLDLLNDKINIKNYTLFDNFAALNADIVDGSISGHIITTDDGKIGFFDSATYFSNWPGISQATFTSPVSLAFTETGIHTGISVEDGSEEYMNLYTSASNGGPSTPSDTDMYVETFDADTYFIKTTKKDHIEDNELKTWQSGSGTGRVDSLQLWPRAGIHAGESSFRNITVNTSTVSERKGVSFGQFNHMYVTGSGTTCPSGWMVLESQNGVVLIDSSSDVIDCEAINYGELTLGDINAFGSVIAQSDISTGGNLSANKKITGQELEIIGDALIQGDSRIQGLLTIESGLKSLADSQFSSNVDILGALNVKNKSTLSNIEVDGVAKFNEPVSIESTLTINDNVTLNENVEINGRLNSNDLINTAALISGETTLGATTINDSIVAKSDLTVQSDLISEGNLQVKGIITGQQTLLVKEGIVEKSLNIGDDLIVQDSLTVNGDTSLNGENTIVRGALLSQGDAQFGGEVEFNGSIKVSSNLQVFNSINVSSAAVLESSLNVKGRTTLESNLSVDGTTNLSDTNIEGSLNIDGNIISEGFIQGDNLILNGSLSSEGQIVTRGSITSNGYEATSGSTSNLDSLTVRGEFSQTNSLRTMEISGRAVFNNVVDINNNLIVDQTLTVGTQSKITIGENRIEIGDDGDRGTLITGNIIVGEISGNQSGVYLPDEIFRTLAPSNNTLSNTEFISVDNIYVEQNAVFAGQAFMTDKLYVDKLIRLNPAVNPYTNSELDWVDIVAREAYYAN